MRCPTLGVVRPAWGGNRKSRCQRYNPELRGDGGDRFTGPEAATGNNHGHGSNGRQVNDNDYQEVNITNIDLDSPSVLGRMEKGLNQR